MAKQVGKEPHSAALRLLAPEKPALTVAPEQAALALAPEQAALAIAAEQDGVASWEQLLAAGISRHTIARFRKTTFLDPLFRGVYLVGGGRPTTGALRRAAVMSSGPRAHLSFRAATANWGLARPRGGPIDVTVAGVPIRGQPGIRTHRIAHPHVDDFTVHNGIRTTSVARTIVDMASIAGPDELDRILEQSEIERLFDLVAIQHALARFPQCGGSAELKCQLAFLEDPTLLRSELERQFRNLLRGSGLPRPAFNVPVGDMQIDAVWLTERVAVEVDSWKYHGHRRQFEEDRKRDIKLQLAGFKAMRVTDRRLAADGQGFLRELGQMLALA